MSAYNHVTNLDNKSLAIDWRQERNIFLHKYFGSLRQMLTKQDVIQDILDDFIIKNSGGCNTQNAVDSLMTIKSTKSLTHLNVAPKKMVERRQDRLRRSKVQVTAEMSHSGKYRLLQVKKDGKERFFIVKGKERREGKGEEAEEIFAEWHKNLNAPSNVVTLKGKKKKSTIKMSQRHKRRLILQDAGTENDKKTMLYADMVKKNLKCVGNNDIEVEDIFESWAENLQEKDCVSTIGYQESEDLDIFKVWRHNLATREEMVKIGSSESEENILSTALPFRHELSGGGCVTIPAYRFGESPLFKHVLFLLT